MRCTIKDIDRVHRVLKHSSIYLNVADDGSPGVDDFTIEPLLSNERCYILMPNRDTVGIAIPLNSIMYDIHINILPESRGDKGYRAGMEFLGYLFKHTPARKLIAYISTLYRNVYDFALLCRFKEEGYAEKSILKGGKLCDQWILGLSEETWKNSSS